MDSEAGVFAVTFDQSGSRLITCDADKTIKIYKEDDTAVSCIYIFKVKVRGEYFWKKDKYK